MKISRSSTNATGAIVSDMKNTVGPEARQTIYSSSSFGFPLTQLKKEKILTPFFGSSNAFSSMYYPQHLGPIVDPLGKDSPGFGGVASVRSTNHDYIERYQNTTYPLSNDAIENIKYHLFLHAGRELNRSMLMMDGTVPGSTQWGHLTRNIVNSTSSIDSKNKKPTLVKSTGSNDNKRVYVDKVRDLDVLCGRGGRSNHHYGNKVYRQVVSDMKMNYKSIDGKKGKTNLSQAIVSHVIGYGGCFLKKEDSTGRYYLLSHAEARKKTSQALREIKETKWTV